MANTLNILDTQIKINIEATKVNGKIYFSAGDIVLALYKTKNALHDIDDLINTLVKTEGDAQNRL